MRYCLTQTRDISLGNLPEFALTDYNILQKLQVDGEDVFIKLPVRKVFSSQSPVVTVLGDEDHIVRFQRAIKRFKVWSATFLIVHCDGNCVGARKKEDPIEFSMTYQTRQTHQAHQAHRILVGLVRGSKVQKNKTGEFSSTNPTR